MSASGVIDHGTSRTGRWLRERRTRLAVWIALVEGILVLVGAIPRWPALGVAVVLLALWFWAGREIKRETPRQVAWVIASSQAAVLLVPVLALVIGTLALIAVAILAVLALAVLFAER